MIYKSATAVNIRINSSHLFNQYLLAYAICYRLQTDFLEKVLLTLFHGSKTTSPISGIKDNSSMYSNTMLTYNTLNNHEMR